MCSIGQNDLT